MNFIKGKIWLYVSVSLIVFGTINTIDKTVFAQENVNFVSINETTDIIDAIVIPLLSQIGPIVGGFVAIGFRFAKNNGLKISADAEEYFVNQVQSFVANQSRMIYKEIRDNPEFVSYLAQGKIPTELKVKAFNNVKRQLENELKSDEFTRAARSMLSSNLDSLIERMVTKNNDDLAQKTKRLFNDLIPIAVSAALLSFKTQEEVQKEKEEIAMQVLYAIEKAFDYERILFSNDVAMLYIKAEINKRIGIIK